MSGANKVKMTKTERGGRILSADVLANDAKLWEEQGWKRAEAAKKEGNK